MGDAADMLTDSMEFSEEAEWADFIAGCWTQKNGVAIMVSEMSDAHVRNTFNMLMRLTLTSDLVDAWIEVFKDETKRRAVAADKLSAAPTPKK